MMRVSPALLVGAALLLACCPAQTAAGGVAMPFRGFGLPGRLHLAKAKAPEPAPPKKCCNMQGALDGAKDFLIGAVSGGIASFTVFPIDMAKTRIQDQRVVAGAEVLYKNALQTIGRVFKEEGLPALYNGVVPVIIGSAPEAALQLGGNNNARAFFAEKLDTKVNDLPLWAEIVSGGFGGVMQVFATNPMERVKIIQQVMGKQSGSTMQVVQKLGLGGLYQGWNACAMRDIPFSAIYFTTYARAKKFLLTMGNKDGKQREETILDALIAGLIAGVPGAGLTVPCDVIKTRMQSTVGKGSELGIRATAKALYAEGGFAAFWKGAVPRVGRVGPQLAICLCIFEALKRVFPSAAPAVAANAKGGKKAAPTKSAPAKKDAKKDGKK